MQTTVRRLALVLATLSLCACVSSPDAKLASTQMTQTLDELQASAASFERLYVRELATTRSLLADAIVARTVRAHVDELARSFDDPEQVAELGDHGLVGISRSIEQAEAVARRLIDQVSAETLDENATAGGALERVVERQKAALERSAIALRQSDQHDDADELEREAAALTVESVFGDDATRADYEALVELGASQAEVPQQLEQLEAHIAVLQRIQHEIDAWIMADVTISGEEVAALLEKHAATLGLGATP